MDALPWFILFYYINEPQRTLWTLSDSDVSVFWTGGSRQWQNFEPEQTTSRCYPLIRMADLGGTADFVSSLKKQWRYYPKACRKKVKRQKKKKSCKSAVPLCFPLTPNHSQAQIIHMYRTPYSQTHAAGLWLQMSAPPWYNSHQGSINFLFLLPAAVYQKGYSSISFPLFPPPPQILLFRLRQGMSGVGVGWKL